MGPTWALRKHTAILKSYSSFIPVNAIRETYCSRPPSVRSLRARLSTAGEHISYFWVQEEKCRRERREKMHTNKEEEEYTTNPPPLDRRPIQCIYNMTGSSESLLLCLARAPQGRLSLSFLLLFISSRLRTGSEERGRTTGAMAGRAWRKGEAHCNRICRFFSGRLKAWIAPKACRKHGVPEMQVKGSDVVAAVTSYVRPPRWT